MKTVLMITTLAALMSACGGSSGKKGSVANPIEGKIEKAKTEELSIQDFNVLTSTAWCGSGVEKDDYGCEIKNNSRLELYSQGDRINQVTVANTDFEVMNPSHSFTIEGHTFTCRDMSFEEGAVTAYLEQVNNSRGFTLSYTDPETGNTIKESMGFSKIQDSEISVVSPDGEYAYQPCP